MEIVLSAAESTQARLLPRHNIRQAAK